MATTIVWFVENQDLAQGLVKAVAAKLADSDAAEFQQRCDKLVTEGNVAGLVEAVAENVSSMFVGQETKAASNDIEGCFNVLCTFLKDITGAQKRRAVETLCRNISAATNAPMLRLHMLSLVYNHLENKQRTASELLSEDGNANDTKTADAKATDRFVVFCYIVKFAGATGNLRRITHYLQDVESVIKAWKCNNNEARQLYLLLTEVHEQNGDAQLAQNYRVQYLATFETASQAELTAESVKSAAATAIKNTVTQSVARADCGVFQLRAVAQLQGDAQYGKLFELLRIFVDDMLPVYVKFYADNKAFVDSLGVEHATAVDNMRLQSLCSLASCSDTIDYATIATTLQVEVSQVERYVVRAIGAKMLDAKMDQLKQVVIVHSCTPRTFNDAQWKRMQERLVSWRNHVRSLLQTVRQRRKEMK